jgi:hypothetical protein
MNDLVQIIGSLANRDITELETEMLGYEQAECPVIHHFGPGICIRELAMKKGTLAIGHRQKFEHINIVLRGKVAVLNVDGSVKIVEAPALFIGQPGRKIGIVLEDVVWQNVYATELKDVAAVEDHFLDKSAAWNEVDQQQLVFAESQSLADRVDFQVMLAEYGFTADVVRLQSENLDDQTHMPSGSWKFKVSPSPIEGSGVFGTMPINAGEVIGPARIGGMRTPLGRFTNHAKKPNARFVLLPNGAIDLVASEPISGAVGGHNGQEITVDYRQALGLSGIKSKDIS